MEGLKSYSEILLAIVFGFVFGFVLGVKGGTNLYSSPIANGEPFESDGKIYVAVEQRLRSE